MVTISFDEFEMFIELLVETGRSRIAVEVVKKALLMPEKEAQEYCQRCHEKLAIYRTIDWSK